MTPKEKAKELVNKFRTEFNWLEKDYDVDLYRDTRLCALIAVEEVLDLQLSLSHDDSCHDIENFYIKVKEEILKM